MFCTHVSHEQPIKTGKPEDKYFGCGLNPERQEGHYYFRHAKLEGTANKEEIVGGCIVRVQKVAKVQPLRIWTYLYGAAAYGYHRGRATARSGS